MRILGVTEKWPKLKQPRWPTFRLPRRDRDWEVGELAQVVYRPRSKGREFLGIARIVKKELLRFPFPEPDGELITQAEAIDDGFEDAGEMMRWFLKTHGARVRQEPLNKLTLEWIGDYRVQNV